MGSAGPNKYYASRVVMYREGGCVELGCKAQAQYRVCGLDLSDLSLVTKLLREREVW